MRFSILVKMTKGGIRDQKSILTAEAVEEIAGAYGIETGVYSGGHPVGEGEAPTKRVGRSIFRLF